MLLVRTSVKPNQRGSQHSCLPSHQVHGHKGDIHRLLSELDGLAESIERLKKDLAKAVCRHSLLSHPEVVEKSRLLDMVVVEYTRLISKAKFMT